MTAKFIVYEVNEVPWPILDLYIKKKPSSCLARLIKEAKSYTTFCPDTGELHPWSTWPTLHRGVANTVHNITFLNQDLSCANEYPPLWELIAQANKKIGVCGSLQSYPVPQDLENVSFYIPDTFSPSPEVHPKRYEAAQAFNLLQTARDGAFARETPFSYYLKSALKLPFSGVSLGSLFKAAGHLMRERKNPLYRTRRSILQAPVLFDVFTHALERSPEVSYASFFTNHIAGMLHRYWKYLVPEDFDEPIEDTPKHRFYANNILKAFDIADQQCEWLYNYSKRNGYELVIISSMGQEAIAREEYIGEPRIEDKNKFMHAIGWQETFEDRLAMQPDFAFELANKEAADKFNGITTRLLSSKGEPVFPTIKKQNNTINLSLKPPVEVVREQCFFYHDEQGNQKKISLDQAGIDVIHRDQGTAYHQPHGICLWLGNHAPGIGEREEVESTQIAPSILRALNIPLLPHHKAPIGESCTLAGTPEPVTVS